MIGYYVSYAPSIGWFAVVYDEHGKNTFSHIRARGWPEVECAAFNECIALCARR